jgi:hypothetical protein
MGIIESLKQTVVNVLDPNRRAQSQELSYLQEIYYNREGNLRPRQWYRLSNERGETVGFSFVCSEGQEYRFLDVFEAFRDHVCPNCKDKFELLKFVGINPAEIPVTQWKSICTAKLPARPGAVTGKQAPAAAQIGDWGGNLPGESADAVGWDDQGSGIAGKEHARRADINQGLW